MAESSTEVDPQFCVLLGPDYAGKSSVLAELSGLATPWRCVSVDDALLGPDHGLIGILRRHLVQDALPLLGTAYSVDFMASLLQTAVLHVRDQILAACGTPVLVDSYYYKILAKCRLSGASDNPMFDWWRTFPQPRRVLYLDVSPETAWRRSEAGARTNPLEYYGERPEWPGFEAYQTDLRKLTLDEVQHLPVTFIGEGDSIAQTVEDVIGALANEFG